MSHHKKCCFVIGYCERNEDTKECDICITPIFCCAIRPRENCDFIGTPACCMSLRGKYHKIWCLLCYFEEKGPNQERPVCITPIFCYNEKSDADYNYFGCPLFCCIKGKGRNCNTSPLYCHIEGEESGCYISPLCCFTKKEENIKGNTDSEEVNKYILDNGIRRQTTDTHYFLGIPYDKKGSGPPKQTMTNEEVTNLVIDPEIEKHIHSMPLGDGKNLYKLIKQYSSKESLTS